MASFILRFFVSFVVIFLLYLIFVIFNRKKSNNILNTNQATIFIKLNKLDINSIDKKCFIRLLAISNSLVLSITFAFIFSLFFDSFILNILFSFLLLIILILVIYKIMGLFLRKKV